jgi:hypothetical protein
MIIGHDEYDIRPFWDFLYGHIAIVKKREYKKSVQK